jgi:hypothetical protein
MAGTDNRPARGGAEGGPLYVSAAGAGGETDSSPRARVRLTAAESSRWAGPEAVLCRAAAGVNAAYDRCVRACECACVCADVSVLSPPPSLSMMIVCVNVFVVVYLRGYSPPTAGAGACPHDHVHHA